MLLPAQYVTVWDSGEIISTSCKIDLAKNPPFVTDIESLDVSDDIGSCIREYVTVNDIQIDTFITDDDRYVEPEEDFSA